VPGKSGWAGISLVLVALAVMVWATPSGVRAAAGSGSAAYQAGMKELTARHYGIAVQDFEQALLAGHTDPGTFYELGLAYRGNHQLNDAAWALAVAGGDPVYAALHPEVTTALQQVGTQGGTDDGPPAALRHVKETPAKTTPALAAQVESRAAVQALQQSNDAYFVAPAFNRKVTVNTIGTLTAAAADLQNNSNTVAKFVFLSAVPAPYKNLSSYAQDLFSALHLQRAIVVAMTPQTVGVYTDRLDAHTTQTITYAQIHSLGLNDPTTLSASVARAVVARADANATAASERSTILGLLFAALIVGAVGGSIWWILRRDSGGVPLTRPKAPARAR
jgi:hypothetical protein